IKGLREQAKFIILIYKVIIYSILINSINTKDYKIFIDNYIVIPNAVILYIGWLTKKSTLKRISFIVLEFIDLEIANAIIYAGIV
ncbi:hypothetical protein K469DRAFT_603407, partial [Zopfia rhizophila CBS 207.26]